MRNALLLTLLWILALPATGFACCRPPAHPGLWTAIEEAEVIALVHVDEVTARDTYSFSKLYYEGYRASLGVASGLQTNWLQSAVRRLPEPDWTPIYRAKVQVLDVFKGSMKAGGTVPLHSSRSCSEGGFFLPGRTTLAFLQRRSGGWHPLPWYNSTVYLEHRTRLAEITQLIRRGADLQARGRVTEEEKYDWVRDALRTVGSRPLVGSDLDLLSEEDIARAFVEIPTVDDFNVKMLEKLAHRESSEVDRQAMRLLEAWLSHSKSQNFFSAELLLLIESRLGHPLGTTSMADLLVNHDTPERWKELRQQMGLVDLDASQALAEKTSLAAWQNKLYGEFNTTYY